VNPDTLSATGPTGDQPTEGSGIDPDMHHLLNPEPFPTEFWDKVLKGKFKRRIYGADVVNVAQKDYKVTNILTLMISHNLTVRGFDTDC
jgi:hypothetical protein